MQVHIPTFGILHLQHHLQRFVTLAPRTQRRPVHLRDTRAPYRHLVEMLEQLLDGFTGRIPNDPGDFVVLARRHTVLQRLEGVYVLLGEETLTDGAHDYARMTRYVMTKRLVQHCETWMRRVYECCDIEHAIPVESPFQLNREEKQIDWTTSETYIPTSCWSRFPCVGRSTSNYLQQKLFRLTSVLYRNGFSFGRAPSWDESTQADYILGHISLAKNSSPSN